MASLESTLNNDGSGDGSLWARDPCESISKRKALTSVIVAVESTRRFASGAYETELRVEEDCCDADLDNRVAPLSKNTGSRNL